jgi:solute carrier family 25 S-adenosylmethionine transporter 26
MKPICARFYGEDHAAWTHMTAAALGECAACIVRVPTEVVKARMQTSSIQLSVRETFNLVLQEHHGSPLSSVTGGLYRGFGMTLFREIPFAAIQFPLYETFKLQLAEYVNKQSASPVQAAACGSLSGAIAGGLTTPLDVLKTRMQVR